MGTQSNVQDQMKCPECDGEVWLATCMNPETQQTRELYACKNDGCGYRRQPCEVYSRVVGYLRPVSGWNKGKKEEFAHRQEYKIGGEQ